MTLAKKFGVNKELVEKGALVVYEGFRIRLKRASTSNPEWLKELVKLNKLQEELTKSNALGEEERIKRAISEEKKLYAKTIIVSWETFREGEWRLGIDDPEDEEGTKPLLEFTPENVLRVLNAFANEDFFIPLFRNKADTLELFQQKNVEDNLGNS